MSSASSCVVLVLWLRAWDLRNRKKVAEQGGGTKAQAKQKAMGKRSARERIVAILDDNSFREYDMFVEHVARDFDMEKKTLQGDGVIIGTGTINGAPICIYAQDFTVAGGSLGLMHSRKICKIMDHALKIRVPIIGINDSGGARIQEGVNSLAGYGEIFYRNTMASGVIPQISVLLGPCAGGVVYSPALMDFVFVVENISKMFITGPSVIKTVLGEDYTMEEIGGAKIHAQVTGNAHFYAENELECFEQIKKLVTLLPRNNQKGTSNIAPCEPKPSKGIKEVVPSNPKLPYDIRDVLGAVVDSSDKAARFIRYCDAFGIPLLVFEDMPGYLPGIDQEHMGVIPHGAKVLYAFSGASVPKITVIIRQAYGGGYIAMNSRHMRADFVFAWPTAESAVMGPAGAANIVFRREIEEAIDPEAMRAEKNAEYREKFANPDLAASKGYVDEVIEPQETRGRLIHALEVSRDKQVYWPEKKHGVPPF
jgi:acetyl-CoA carboxylase carboxyltransferase component